MIRFLLQDNFVIETISETEYLAQFGSTFEQPTDDAPLTGSTIDELLDGHLDLLAHDEIRDMIAAQSNSYYKDAILIRAIVRGKFNVLDGEERLNRTLRYHQSDWTVDTQTASALHKHGLQVRFYRVIGGVAQEWYNNSVALGVFTDVQGGKWIAVTTTESRDRALSRLEMELELIETESEERGDEVDASGILMYKLGVEAVSAWSGVL